MTAPMTTREFMGQLAANPYYDAMTAADIILPGRLNPARASWRAIVAVVADRRGVTVSEIMSRAKQRRIAYARFEAWAEIRENIPLASYPIIAEWFAVDHSTVLHGVRRWAEIRNFMEDNQ